jgi:phenylalanyl-tRNA synthetase alpha chain
MASMQELQTLKTKAQEAIRSADNLDALEKVRVSYLGKSGLITEQMKTLGTLPVEERKQFGATLNTIKNEITQLIDDARGSLEHAAIDARLATETVDITLPARPEAKGSIHPISQVMEEVVTILGSLGFKLADGPDIEDDFHNFSALNIPESHPARQMHDTFYLPAEENGRELLLRTHTSPVQIRAMQNGKPPFKVIAMGRTYRCDSDMTHSPMFHQVECLYIDKKVTMGHLKGCLSQFVNSFFGKDVPLRFRPSFFPFTEPSAEVDIGCSREGGELKIGAGKDWLEILGCGMVHPNVLSEVGLDPKEYQGFAFGAGIERIGMLKYGIPDLRTFFEPDMRWLKHYSFGTLDIPSLIRGL